MVRKKKYRYQKRTFLNADEQLRAYIIAYVRESGEGNNYTDIQLEIADCSRQINLDFDFDNDTQSIKRAEKKLNLFRTIINEFADAVQEELDYYKTKPKIKKKKFRRPEEVEIVDI